MLYVALIHKEIDSDYGVSFPDIAGCISAGATIEEAIREAADALSGHIALMKSDGDIVPAPRTADAILADPDLADELEGATLAFIPLVENRGTKVRVNLSLDSGLLDAIDQAARSRGLTRSAFLANAARREIVGS